MIFFYFFKKGCKNTIFLVPAAFFVFLRQNLKMFYYLNKSLSVQLILILLLLAWAVFTIVTQVTVTPADGQLILFQHLAGFWQQHPTNLKVSAVLMLLVETLLLARYYSVNRFAENQTYIPVVFFLLAVNVGGVLTTLTPAVITVVIMTVVLMLNAMDENERPVKNRVFTSGLLVGIASLFDPVAVFAVVFLLLSLITHRYSKSKEILIMLFGLLFVYAYLFSVAFFTDGMTQLVSSLKNLSFFGFVNEVKTLSVFDYVFVGFTVLLVTYLIIQLKLYYDNKLIVLRKRLVNIHFLMFALAAMLVFSGLPFSHSLLYVMPTIALYFGMITQYKSRIILHDVLIVAFFVLLWL